MAYTRYFYHLLPNYRYINGSKDRPDFIYKGQQIGEKVVGFKDKIKRSVNAASPYQRDAMRIVKEEPMSGTVTEYFHHLTLGVISVTPRKLVGFHQTIGSHGFNHASSTSVNDEAEALSRLYSRIREYSYGINGLQFLGELRQTIQMIRNPAQALFKNTEKYLSTLKSTRKEINSTVRMKKSETPKAHRVRKANAVKDAMSGSWLEYKFGLLPLVSDVQDIATTALEISEPKYVKTVFRGASKPVFGYSSLVKSYNSTTLSSTGAIRQWVDYGVKTQASVRYVAGFKRTVDLPREGLGFLAQSFGFQLQNFVPTLWELFPWSFLIDYFVNVGDVLEAATTDVSGLVYCTKTTKQTSTFECQAKLGGYNYGKPGWNCYPLTGKIVDYRKFERVTLVRTVHPTIPMPSLTFSIPGSDSSKWYNMSALLAQAKNFRYR